MTPNDEPIYRFNTNSIALERKRINERDVPRYEAMTKGILGRTYGIGATPL